MRGRMEGRQDAGRGWLVAVCLLLAVAAALVAAGASRLDGADAESSRQSTNAGSGRTEMAGERTEFSRTFREPDGSNLTQLSHAPLNFRDATGAWQPIDTTLVPVGDGALASAAGPVAVTVPETAAEPVSVAQEGRTVAFTLLGADEGSLARADGAEAVFEAALPGVTAVYEAQAGGVKETLLLADAQAPRRFEFALTAPGLTPALQQNGDVVLADAGGTERFRLLAPWMQDAAGELSRAAAYELETVGGQQRLVLTVDAGWLSDPARVFPVAVDPTVTGEPDGVCTLVSGASANTADCSSNGPVWVGRSGGKTHRAVIALPDSASVVDDEELVIDGWIDYRVLSRSTTADSDLDIFSATRDVADGATWNRATPSIAWTTPGGDLRGQRESRQRLTSALVGRRVQPGIQRYLEREVEGRPFSNAIVVKSANESVDHLDGLGDFVVNIRWHDRLGLGSQYSFERLELPGGMAADVNLGNGNLVLRVPGPSLPGYRGRALASRFWNSYAAGYANLFGIGEEGDFGSIAIEEIGTGNALLAGFSGVEGMFVERADGSFDAPAGVAAVLREHADDSFTLFWEDTNETWTFSDEDPHRLVRAEDAYGYVLEGEYDRDGDIVRLTGSDGASLVYGYAGFSEPSTITAPDGVHRYEYDAGHDIASYTAPDRSVTRFTFDGVDRAEEIEWADGSSLEVYYAGNWWPELVLRAPGGAVRTHLDFTGSAGPAGYTDVHRDSDPVRRFLYTAGLVAASEQRLPTAATTLALSGRLATSANATLTPGSYPLTFVAGDPGGIARVEISVDGVLDRAWSWDCTTACPRSQTATWTLNSADLPAGESVVRVTAIAAGGERRAQAIRFVAPYSATVISPRTRIQPTIGGRAADGEMLTASTRSWVGAHPFTFQPQWRRCNATGTACQDIAGENGWTYTATGADVGATLVVTVRARNARGVGTSHSAATGPIAGSPPVNVQLPELLGRPNLLLGSNCISGDCPPEGTLTVDDGVWRGSRPFSYDYQWEACTSASPSSCTAIPDATDPQYDVPETYDAWMRVTVTAYGPYGSAVASSPVRRIVYAQTLDRGDIGFMGTARVGQLLSAIVPHPGVRWTPQWLRCDADGGDCRAIPGATGQDYLITTEDFAQRLRLRVIYDGGTIDDSGVSAVVRGALLAPRRFAMVLDGEELWTAKLDGTDARRVHAVSYADDLKDVAVSPDGDTVAMITTRGIELVGANGRGRRLLLEAPSPGGSGSGPQSPSSVAFSPSGDTLIFGAYSPVDFATGIFTVEIANAAVTRLDGGWTAEAPFTDRSLPAYSPRGDRIAYLATNGSQEAIVTAAAGGGVESAVEVGAHVEAGTIAGKPRISEDGGEVAFSGLPLGGGCGEAVFGLDVATQAIELRSWWRNCGVALTRPSWTGPGDTVLAASSDDTAGGGVATRAELVDLATGDYDVLLPNTGKPITALELPQTSVPTVFVAGLDEQNSLYSNGSVPLAMTVSAADWALGIEALGHGPTVAVPMAMSPVPCDSLCPPEGEHTLQVATTGLPDGASQWVAFAQNAAGTVGQRPMRILVDRAAPVPITAPGVHSSDAVAQTATVTWGTAYDPDLPGDLPGAGVTDQQFRWHTAATGWSAWAPAGDGAAVLTGIAPGTPITLEGRATDAVGNTATTSRTVDWNPPPPDPDDEIDGIEWPPSEPGLARAGGVICDGLFGPDRDATSAPFPQTAYEERNAGIAGLALVRCVLRTRGARPPKLRLETCIMLDDPALGTRGCWTGELRGETLRTAVNVICWPDRATYSVRLRWWKLPILPGADPVEEPRGPSVAYDCNNPGAWRASARARAGSPDDSLRANIQEANDQPPANADGSRTTDPPDNGFELKAIIPLTSPAAARLQGLGHRCLLSPTAPYNGVWLRGSRLQDASDARARRSSVGYKRLSRRGRGRPYVADFAGPGYGEAVYRRLSQAVDGGSCDFAQAQSIMREIKEDLEEGEIPGRRTDARELALLFRPLMHFDSEEPWRPLDVPRFFTEGRDHPDAAHRICRHRFPIPDDCDHPMDSWRDLRSQPARDVHMDFNGDGDVRRSPRAGCATAALWDCDRGVNSAMYWHMVDRAGAYRYLDYWVFYRYNRYRSESVPDVGDHEGDWENVAVAVRKSDPYTFDFVSFAGHESRFRYLRGVLSCDGRHDPGSCGTEIEPRGRRIDTYVAHGSHAAYPRRCDSADCRRTDPRGGIPPEPSSERRFDGMASWGSNDDDDTLKAFPSPGGDWNDEDEKATATWVDWPARWGTRGGLSDAPQSPGVRGVFRAPWSNTVCTERYTPDGDDCDDIVVVRRAGMASRAAAPASDACAPWQGPFVQVSVCDPETVERSMREGFFAAADAPAAVTGLRPGDAVGAAGGVMQVAGQQLEPGDSIELTIRTTGAVDLAITANDPARALTSHFDDVIVRRGQRVKVTIDGNAPTARLRLGNGARITPDAITRDE